MSTSAIQYAIWAAVSTPEQAANDKSSLSAQVASLREHAQRQGWIESAGPYLIPAESRSTWVDLSVAIEASPSLGQLLADAREHKFDRLVLSADDRLRDLVELVGPTLNHSGIRLDAVSQASEPLLPEATPRYASDTKPIPGDVSKNASHSAVNDMRRKYFENMPERVRAQGLNAISLPYGYKKPEVTETERNKAIAVQDPALVPHILAMKDLFLAGKSLRQIRDHLTAVGAPTPRGKGTWHSRVIRDILTNPFYAGIVRFGVSRVTHALPDGKKERRDRTPDASRLVTAPGKHVPLWDAATHQALLVELGKRLRNYRGQISQRLTGLLSCYQCGARLHMHYRYKKGEPNNTITWRCSRGGAPHISVIDEVMLEQVITELLSVLDHADPPSEKAPDPTAGQLEELLARKKRLGDAYESGALDLADYSARVKRLNADIAKLEDTAQNLSNQLAEERQHEAALQFLRANRQALPEYVRHGDQQDVNHTLRAIFAEITVGDEGTIVKAGLKKRV